MNRIEVIGADKNKVGHAVKAMRRERGLTQNQVATRMQGYKSTVEMLETGRVRSSIGTVEAVARALGYRLDIIFTEVADE